MGTSLCMLDAKRMLCTYRHRILECSNKGDYWWTNDSYVLETLWILSSSGVCTCNGTLFVELYVLAISKCRHFWDFKLIKVRITTFLSTSRIVECLSLLHWTVHSPGSTRTSERNKYWNTQDAVITNSYTLARTVSEMFGAELWISLENECIVSSSLLRSGRSPMSKHMIPIRRKQRWLLQSWFYLIRVVWTKKLHILIKWRNHLTQRCTNKQMWNCIPLISSQTACTSPLYTLINCSSFAIQKHSVILSCL